MSEDTGWNLAKLIMIGMAVQLLVIGYVFFQSYEGRKQVVENQQIGCERGKKDRLANASGWRIAEAARRDSGEIKTADRYASLARGLERRARINCQTAYPKASFIP